MAHELTQAQLAAFRDEFAHDQHVKPIQHAAMRNGVLEASYNPEAAAKLNHTFSVEVPTGKVSNQKQSGRCWLFSLLNTLRHQFAIDNKVKDFELSQSYLYFWDKIERANIYYDNIIRTADRPTDDREVAFYLSMPGDDGGQWAMAASLVAKYGVVPKEVMPETFNTEATAGFAEALNLKLRRDALTLRELKNNGATTGEITARRQKLLQEVYRMTAIAVGEPPVQFDLEYRDDDKNYHLDQDLTPTTFFEKYFKMNLNDYVVLTNAPDKAYNQAYRLASEENVVGGLPIIFTNMPMASLRRAAIAQLKAGETVWFGNDVGKQVNRKEGLLDSQLYQKDALFGVDLSLNKADRFRLGEAEVTHAMTLTGVDLIDDQPTKWKVENSWGVKNGADGYFVMSDDWFEDYSYEVVVQRKYLTDEEIAAADSEPVLLPAWDSLM
ncbi:C1 family peptidase [Lapidilactobacillus wuchangensis]|uniref:C1 family peptidase n=1 Tax=Lapidilactobacillus wuchangensis TaxID=2486001 RepID=UPI000F7B6A52|nr:C1 family peptidase [Lapidilactobacillus wuchangensis]